MVHLESRTRAHLCLGLFRKTLEDLAQRLLVEARQQFQTLTALYVEHDLHRIGRPRATAKPHAAAGEFGLLGASIGAAPHELAVDGVPATQAHEPRACAPAPITRCPLPAAAMQVAHSELAATSHSNDG